MATEKRWHKAQNYERNHWQTVASSIARDQTDLNWYEWRAQQLIKRIRAVDSDFSVEDQIALEIGSGPVGTISFLPATRRVALDPLADFYSSQPELIRHRHPSVKYLKGGGESLSFGDAEFSMVIIENVIDHTLSPESVLSEIRRVLVPGGYLFLTVNVHSAWGLWLRRLMEVFELDKGHPHNYSQYLAQSLIIDGGFEILSRELEDSKRAKQKELDDGRFRTRVKVCVGIYDMLFEVLAKRN